MTFKENKLTQPCRYNCGTTITWKGKVEGKKGSTGWFEVNGDQNIEHTYSRCFELREGKKERNE